MNDDTTLAGGSTRAQAFTPNSAGVEEDLLAFLLIRTWTLVTGRSLRSDVPPAELSEDELIAFWADDHITTSGRQGRTAAP